MRTTPISEEQTGRRVPAARSGIDVQRDEYPRTAPVCVLDTSGRLHWRKIQAGKVSRVEPIAKADVDRSRAIVDGGVKRRQAACRAHQLYCITLSHY